MVKKEFVDGVIRLFVDYNRPLADMICDGKYDWVNKAIIEKDFPINRRSNGEVEMKVFSTEDLFGEFRNMKSEEISEEMDKRGYRPAELPEILAYGAKYPDECPIVGLGFVWRDSCGGRYVPCLGMWFGKWGLGLGWFGDGWLSNCRFLAVRKS